MKFKFKSWILGISRWVVELLPDKYVDKVMKETDGPGIVFGIIVAIVSAFIVGGTMLLLSLVVDMPKAHASTLYSQVMQTPIIATTKTRNYWFDTPPYITFGLLYDARGNICTQNDAFGNKIISDIMLGQKVWRSANWRHSFDALYSHNSCAFARDEGTVDAFGVSYTYQIWGK